MAFSSGKAPAASKAEYLKRYLEPRDKDGLQKKRKKKKKQGNGMRIVDDDAEDWKKLSSKQEEAAEEEEDQPVVAEFVDERPEHVKRMEEFRTSNKWKLFQDTTDESPRLEHLSPSPPQRQRHDSPDPSPPRRQRHDSPDASPLRKGRHDSPDPSPPRGGRHDSPDSSPPQRSRGNTHDPSPPRRGKQDLPDPSPSRRGRHDSPDPSPSRRGRHSPPDISPPRRGRHSPPDISPPRRGRHSSPDTSPPRRGKRDSPDLSLSRKRHESPIHSSPRRRRPDSLYSSISGKGKNYSSSNSERKRHRYDSPDCSGGSKYGHNSIKPSPTRKDEQISSKYMNHKTKQQDSSSLHRKTSPAQKKRKPAKQDYSDSDLSPPRQTKSYSHLPPPQCLVDSDSDLSPPRKAKNKGSDCDLSPPRSRNDERRETSVAKPGGSRMLSGGRAGLVSAEVLKEEKEELRKGMKANTFLEEESRNSETVFRDKSGKRRDLKIEREQQQQKQALQDKKNELYAKWGKGLAQKEQQRKNVEDATREMEKPLARYIDDSDLDKMLREQEREGDPMAKFLKKKKTIDGKERERPKYKGPNPPLNRFNIWPGYRWDGVDRSNGFEKQYFARMSEKKATQEAAYKWSVEDM
ncbi:hypothetical protein GDO86_012761 [Hymenochirus boettgeri]|uniref:BUD13 homolog n=1 Tax=Hymenochirus boettgeri TaxID=247094 RepID=A0A8T2IVN6_9PIPI|nr:hypothetical protein GDO86_012761 [Hymenochirus boettgeri]